MILIPNNEEDDACYHQCPNKSLQPSLSESWRWTWDRMGNDKLDELMRREKEGEKREKGGKVGSVHSLEMEVVALIGHRGAEMVDTVGHHVATTGHYSTLFAATTGQCNWWTLVDHLGHSMGHR